MRPFVLLVVALTLPSCSSFAVVIGIVIERGATSTLAAWTPGLGGRDQAWDEPSTPSPAAPGPPSVPASSSRPAASPPLRSRSSPAPCPLLIALSIGVGMVRCNLTLLQAAAVTDRWGARHYGRLSLILIAPVTATGLAPFAAQPSRRLPSALSHPRRRPGSQRLTCPRWNSAGTCSRVTLHAVDRSTWATPSLLGWAVAIQGLHATTTALQKQAFRAQLTGLPQAAGSAEHHAHPPSSGWGKSPGQAPCSVPALRAQGLASPAGLSTDVSICGASPRPQQVVAGLSSYGPQWVPLRPPPGPRTSRAGTRVLDLQLLIHYPGARDL
jgi:hypothetical protein